MTQPPRILLTGQPGCGKTTVILRVLELLDRAVAGFYTTEVREGGARGAARVGFDVVSVAGARGPLARVGFEGPRVGRYGVDVATFDRIGVQALAAGLEDPAALLIVDELGKMECLSPRFVELLPRIFASPNALLGTVLSRPHPVVDRFRAAPGVEIIRVTAESRDLLPGELAPRLSA